ncbi:asparagine synthase (glutamine-hydrolyzing) [Luminiphilus sp.]|nr:asparagine synthase (glutamine-hydrolyzing) [Luminiphilus sp.]
MCGITGYLKANPGPDNPSLIKSMLAMIRHRGPDEMGYFINDSVALGTARLSVIDIAHGQQPLCDAAGRYWISYNGEVYNYPELRKEMIQHGVEFLTDSDTEVVLNAFILWGTASFSRLNGGFAFCIYDREQEEAWLVRDSFGKRPLFYSEYDQGLVYGSELKTFLPHPKINFELDPDALKSICSLWVPLNYASAFKNIAQVPAGSYLHYCGGTSSISQYYSLDFKPPDTIISGNQAIEQAKELLHDAVKIRLRSDVEVGTYLSGGLDSAIVTRLAQEYNQKQVRTFSVEFEDETFDESEEQQLLCEEFGTDHSALKIGSGLIAEQFPHAIWHGEVPVFRTAFVPLFCLSKLVRETGIKVVLTGEGADESFYGYNIFKEALVRSKWGEFESPDAKLDAVAGMYPYIPQFRENAKSYVSLFERFVEQKSSPYFSHLVRFHNSQMALRLFSDKSVLGNQLDELLPASFEQWGVLGRARWLEYQTLLMGYLLSTQGDRASFAHGVETRAPFMDRRVVEFATSVDSAMHLTASMSEKNLLKQAFQSIIPERIVNRAKQPYRAPDAASFLGDNEPDYLEEICSPESLASVDFLDTKFCSKLVEKVRSAVGIEISARENQAFLLLISILWLHRFFVLKQYPESTDIEDILVREINLGSS